MDFIQLLYKLSFNLIQHLISTWLKPGHFITMHVNMNINLPRLVSWVRLVRLHPFGYLWHPGRWLWHSEVQQHKAPKHSRHQNFTQNPTMTIIYFQMYFCIGSCEMLLKWRQLIPGLAGLICKRKMKYCFRPLKWSLNSVLNPQLLQWSLPSIGRVKGMDKVSNTSTATKFTRTLNLRLSKTASGKFWALNPPWRQDVLLLNSDAIIWASCT